MVKLGGEILTEEVRPLRNGWEAGVKCGEEKGG
jgi:hypothetical protein